MIGKKPAKLRLVFVDSGSFHSLDIEVPAKALERHARLVDCLREDSDVLANLHVDVARLCAAYRIEE